MQAAKGAEQASPIQIRLNNSDDLASKLTALHLLLAVNARTLLMFLFVLAKLLPERHNLYGNSLDFKLKYMREKVSVRELLLPVKEINVLFTGTMRLEEHIQRYRSCCEVARRPSLAGSLGGNRIRTQVIHS